MGRLIGHRSGRYAIYWCRMSHDDTDLFEIARILSINLSDQ